MIEKKCMYFGVCGGCQIQGLSRADYAIQKTNHLKEILFDIPFQKLNPIIMFDAGIRRKATFKIDYGCNIGFFKSRSNDVVPVLKCPLLLDEINCLISPLRKLFKSFVKRSDGSITVVKVDNGMVLHFEDIGVMPLDISKIKKFAEDYEVIRITAGREILYKKCEPFVLFNGVKILYPPKTFLQPAKESEQAIVDVVLSYIDGKNCKKVADLFCGLGLFSFFLKDVSEEIFAVDCDDDAVKYLNKISASNHFNIKAKQADLFTRPIKDNKLNEFDVVVLDPPRDGAELQCVELAKSNVKTLIYVSCNPLVFVQDAKILVDGGYKLKEITPIDQFPNTKHLELVCFFEREN